MQILSYITQTRLPPRRERSRYYRNAEFQFTELQTGRRQRAVSHIGSSSTLTRAVESAVWAVTSSQHGKLGRENEEVGGGGGGTTYLPVLVVILNE